MVSAIFTINKLNYSWYVAPKNLAGSNILSNQSQNLAYDTNNLGNLG